MSRTQFNTGRQYTSEGQRIVAEQVADGSVHFHDIDRMIHGYLTDSTCLYGADPGPATAFGVLTEAQIQREVRARYANGDRYRSHSPTIGACLRWVS